MIATEDSALPRTRTYPAWFMPAAIVGSIIAGFVGDAMIGANKALYFKPPPGMPPYPPEYIREQMWNEIYNHIICFGALGALVCAVLGMIVGGVVNPTRSMMGCVLGSLLGLLVGAVVGVIGYFTTQALMQNQMESMYKAVIIFAPVWIAIGITATLLSVFLLRRKDLIGKAIGMGVMFGLLAVIVYPLVASIAFPAGWPGMIIPTIYGTRLTGSLVGAVCTAIAVIMTFKPAKVKATKDSTAVAEPDAA